MLISLQRKCVWASPKSIPHGPHVKYHRFICWEHHKLHDQNTDDAIYFMNYVCSHLSNSRDLWMPCYLGRFSSNRRLYTILCGICRKLVTKENANATFHSIKHNVMKKMAIVLWLRAFKRSVQAGTEWSTWSFGRFTHGWMMPFLWDAKLTHKSAQVTRVTASLSPC